MLQALTTPRSRYDVPPLGWIFVLAAISALLFAIPLFAGKSAPGALAQPSPGHFVYRSPAGGDDTVILSRAGGRILFVRGNERHSTAAAQMRRLTVELGGGDDRLIVDFAQGSPVPSEGILYDGGAGGFDTLELRGGNHQRVVYDYINSHDGSITLDGHTLTYRGLEPIVNSGNAGDAIFNLTPGPDFAFLEDNGNPNDGMIRLRSGDGGFEQTDFLTPVNSLTINGLGGNDSLNIQPKPLDPLPVGGIIFNGGDGSDQLAILDGNASNITHILNGAGGGSILQDSNAIHYTGITASIFDNRSPQTIQFDIQIPNVTTILGDDTFNVDNFSRLTFGGGPQIDFANPITVTVNGSGGDDNFQIDIFDPNLNSVILFDGREGVDTLLVNGTNGNDAFQINPTPPGYEILRNGKKGFFQAFEDIHLNGGAGSNDQASLHGTEGDDAASLFKGSGGALFMANFGQYNFVQIERINTSLLGGDDIFTLDLIGGLPLPVRVLNVSGGDGKNELRFENGSLTGLEFAKTGETDFLFDFDTGAGVFSGSGSSIQRVRNGLFSQESSLFLDNFATQEIFADGFESGDVSAWSYTKVPRSVGQIPEDAAFGMTLRNPSAKLTIHSRGGDDQLILFRLDEGFAIEVNGGDGTDSLHNYPGQAVTATNFESVQDLLLLYLPQTTKGAASGLARE